MVDLVGLEERHLEMRSHPDLGTGLSLSSCLWAGEKEELDAKGVPDPQAIDPKRKL